MGARPPARGLTGHRSRSRLTLPLFAFGASLTFVLVPMVDPTAAFAISSEVTAEQLREAPVGQSFTASAEAGLTGVDRGRYGVKLPVVKKVADDAAPASGTPDPGSAQAIAKRMVADRGWGDAQFDCLVALWNKESHWNVYASNPGSGAYGIPQAYPGTKMASAGSDWKTNPATQIEWGLGYIAGRYGKPCNAWATSQATGSY